MNHGEQNVKAEKESADVTVKEAEDLLKQHLTKAMSDFPKSTPEELKNLKASLDQYLKSIELSKQTSLEHGTSLAMAIIKLNQEG